MLSTIGVLLGLMVMGQPFGVVMTGIGVIANAGVIVNNNIVLIDTYDRLRREGMAAYEAILETCRERARPVVLTAVTAILGVLPIAFGMNIEFLSREVTVGAPATQWWISLSTAIVFGLGFATLLTLIVTPAALMAIAQLSREARRWLAAFKRRARRSAAGAERRGCGLRKLGDQPRAAAEGDEIPEPGEGDDEAVLQADQEIDVRHAPEQPADEAFQLEAVPSFTIAARRPMVARSPMCR